jgi:hypothetical protein
MSGSKRNDARLGVYERCGELVGLGQVDGHCGACSADTSKESRTDVLRFAIFMEAFSTIGSAMLLRLGLGVYMAHSDQNTRSPRGDLVVCRSIDAAVPPTDH